MARCEECLHFEVCEALEQGNGIMKVSPIHCGCYKPTTDVVPRAEVAREIFGEIDYVTKEHASGDIDDHWLYVRLDELKRKYTEEKE